MSKKTKAEPSAPLKADYNPDVLSCLANLSNDEVFTPPEVANAMLDLLPQKIFSDPNAKFLDPACKSGVFLREIAKRLIAGLADKIPDLQKRIDHIFKEQLYAIAITELTSLLSRRSVYCSKDASGKYSVSKFKGEQGNIFFKPTKHLWINGKCLECGASQSEYGDEERQGLESHAYQFIHKAMPGEIRDMKFDVIIGNPPYQLETGGGSSSGKQAKPIYQLFVNQAKKLNPSFLIMVTPSRWFAGGMGLEEYRNQMLNDRHIKEIVDYSMSTDCFPGVDIAGGVSYFCWDKNYKGDCKYTYIDAGVSTTKMRILNEYEVFVRNNKAIDIVKKILSYKERSISENMSSLGVFGLNSSERGHKNRKKDDYILLSSNGRSYIEKNKIKKDFDYISKWKVIIGKATSAGAATADKDGLRKVIATLDTLEPNAICTFSYFIGGVFDTKREAENCKAYLRTKFVRFLLLQCLSSINITKDKFRFVPLQKFSSTSDINWNATISQIDNQMYKKYNLSQDEINLIEKMIREM